jgi:hypothetical protein
LAFCIKAAGQTHLNFSAGFEHNQPKNERLRINFFAALYLNSALSYHLLSCINKIIDDYGFRYFVLSLFDPVCNNVEIKMRLP